MGDQQRWFKFWYSAGSDDAIVSLPPELRWAWVMLGAHTKMHGTNGSVEISDKNAALAGMIGVTVEDLKKTVKALPHVHVEEGQNRNGTFTVTWDHWQKYQTDSTVRERQKSFRMRKRNGLRGEEKRGEERKNISPLIPHSGELKNDQEGFWKSYPLRNGTRGSKKKALDQWKSLTPEQRKKAMEALEAQKLHYEKTKASGGFVAEFPDAWRWLRDRRYEDEIQAPKTQTERFLEILNATK